jgi:hypothetical protein
MGAGAGRPSMSARLEAAFPGLRATSYQVTSPADPSYNCIAWAVGANADWWWPLSADRKTYWPAGAPREVSLSAFVATVLALGYTVCSGESVESGSAKIALFVDSAGVPTHAARQLPTGRWTSKLGQSVDIEHDLRALEGDVYGAVAVILQRTTRMG